MTLERKCSFFLVVFAYSQQSFYNGTHVLEGTVAGVFQLETRKTRKKIGGTEEKEDL